MLETLELDTLIEELSTQIIEKQTASNEVTTTTNSSTNSQTRNCCV